ncbi:MAG: hypothetical protein HGA90_02865 [Alphaproteobacteria bacterium]|nr:hypothetical protein [Alphaproteobacteria bacterium]
MKKIMETYDDTNPSVNLGFRVYEGLSGPGGSPQRTIIVARNLSTHHLAYLVEIKDGRIGIQTTSSEGYPIEIWCSYTPNEPKPHNPLGPILSAKAGNNINLPPNAPEVYPALVQMLLAANKKADPTIAVKIDNLGNGTGIVLLQGKGRTTRVDLVGKKIGLKTVFKNYKTPSMDIHTGLNNVEWGDQLLFTETANNIARKIAPMFSHLSVGNIGTLAASLTRTMYLDSLKATQLYASFLGNKRLFEELPTFDVLPNDLPSLETYLGTPPSAPSQATKSGSTQKKSMTKKANLNKKSPKPSSTKTVIPTKKVPATEKQLLQDKKTREVRADQRCPGLLPRCNI